ncbi:hypothetical protein Pelo_2553 [Pelomyxa schiedti]|nr:hypothetical protein Pelo_2553 [Pelomyxa schiedti]
MIGIFPVRNLMLRPVGPFKTRYNAYGQRTPYWSPNVRSVQGVGDTIGFFRSSVDPELIHDHADLVSFFLPDETHNAVWEAICGNLLHLTSPATTACHVVTMMRNGRKNFNGLYRISLWN